MIACTTCILIALLYTIRVYTTFTKKNFYMTTEKLILCLLTFDELFSLQNFNTTSKLIIEIILENKQLPNFRSRKRYGTVNHQSEINKRFVSPKKMN